jgi:hypothetical protein
MKLKPALLAAIGLLGIASSSQAGPSISISFGSGGCFSRPVICPQQSICQRAYYPCAPVVYYNPVPVCYQYGTTRYSNVSGFVTGEQGVIRVSPPVFPVQPVTVYEGNSFRWR